MRRIAIYIAGLLLLCGTPVRAQDNDYAAFLEQIALRSPQLTAAEKGFRATARGLRTGLSPEDPEVDLEYYFTDGQRYELEIAQRFDFPTVYHQRNQISKLSVSRAEQEFFLARRELMATISDSYLALNYAERRIEVLRQRQTEMQRLVDLYEEGVEKGQSTILDLRNARMMLSASESLLAMAEAGRREAYETLRQLNGGRALAAEGYPQFVFSGTAEEFTEAALALDYELQAAAIDTLIARRELKLSRQEWLPRLKIGYKVEVEGTRGTNALLAGISLPLWQNRGKVKYAKALGEAAQAGVQATEASVRARLNALYSRYETLSAALERQRSLHPEADYPVLLQKALEAGVLDSVSALLSLEEWYDLLDTLLELEYETAMAGAAMTLCLM